MLKNCLFSLSLLLIFCQLGYTQNPTVGLLFYDVQATDGYTLFAPGGSTKTFLIDNCGYIVKEWNCIEIPELSVYLLDDGSLLRVSDNLIEKRSWNDDLLWEFVLDDNGIDIWNHHDVEPLPNGNVLIIGAETFSANAMIQNGRNPSTMNNFAEIDGIYEIEQTGLESGNLVWQWKASDRRFK